MSFLGAGGSVPFHDFSSFVLAWACEASSLDISPATRCFWFITRWLRSTVQSAFRIAYTHSFSQKNLPNAEHPNTCITFEENRNMSLDVYIHMRMSISGIKSPKLSAPQCCVQLSRNSSFFWTENSLFRPASSSVWRPELSEPADLISVLVDREREKLALFIKLKWNQSIYLENGWLTWWN